MDEFIYFDIVQPSQLAFLYKILPAKDFGGLFVSKLLVFLLLYYGARDIG